MLALDKLANLDEKPSLVLPLASAPAENLADSRIVHSMLDLLVGSVGQNDRLFVLDRDLNRAVHLAAL